MKDGLLRAGALGLLPREIAFPENASRLGVHAVGIWRRAERNDHFDEMLAVIGSGAEDLSRIRNRCMYCKVTQRDPMDVGILRNCGFQGRQRLSPARAEMFNQLSVNSVSLGTLTDVISYALELDIAAKQSLLAEGDVDRRAKRLLSHLKSVSSKTCPAAIAAGFPPAFSSN